MLGFVILDRIRISRIHCPHCGQKYDYDNDVEWHEADSTIYDKKSVSTIEFKCTCSECGKTTTFSKRFTTSSFDSNGNLKHTSCDSNARKYFKEL